MNNHFISPLGAEVLARKLFIERSPKAADWFDSAWEAARHRQPPKASTSGSLDLGGLGVLGGSDLVPDAIVSDFIVFCRTFIQKHPMTVDALLKLLADNSKANGKNDHAIAKLLHQAEKGLEVESEFVIWSGKSSIDGVSTNVVSLSHVERELLPHSHDYDIFVLNRKISAKLAGEFGPVKLDERNYKLLVMLLRYRGHCLPSLEAYKKAWRVMGLVNDRTPKDVVPLYLRRSISELRAKLQSSEDEERVRGFMIPPKSPDHGYVCTGTFKFAVIISRDLESAFNLNLSTRGADPVGD